MPISTNSNPLGISGGGGTDAYIQDGLVLHLDGINDGGLPGVWKDLSPEGNDMILKNALRIDKGYDFETIGPSGVRACGLTVKTVLPAYTDTVTAEAVLVGLRGDHAATITMGGALQQLCAVGYKGSGHATYGTDILGLRRFNIRASQVCVLNAGRSSYLVGGKETAYSPAYVTNGVYCSPAACGAVFPPQVQNAGPPVWDINLIHPNNGTGLLHAFRVYNRALTPEELAHNYELDKRRYDLQEHNHIEVDAKEHKGVALPATVDDGVVIHDNTSDVPWVIVTPQSVQTVHPIAYVDIQANTTGVERRGRVLCAIDNRGTPWTRQYMTIRQSA